jgi:transketolase
MSKLAAGTLGIFESKMNNILTQAKSAAKLARASAVTITAKSKSSHVGSCLSVIDILATLFALKFSQKENHDDQIILSKGHAAAALYCVLDAYDLLEDNLESYCENNSNLYGHVNHHASGYIPISTGSLGHGMPFGVGIALANKLKKVKNKTFVVISDGELNEGTTWESALFAGHHGLSNLVVIIDRNRIQSLGFTEETLSLDPIDMKWTSFGWNTVEINGHDYREILDASLVETTKPLCIIANTIKGKGVTFMENTVEWHYKSATDNELQEALVQIERGL